MFVLSRRPVAGPQVWRLPAWQLSKDRPRTMSSNSNASPKPPFSNASPKPPSSKANPKPPSSKASRGCPAVDASSAPHPFVSVMVLTVLAWRTCGNILGKPPSSLAGTASFVRAHMCVGGRRTLRMPNWRVLQYRDGSRPNGSLCRPYIQKTLSYFSMLAC